MALQIRRGTNAERQLIIPLQGEIIFTTDTKQLYVGDGTTLGGVAVDTTGGGGTNTTYGISAETVTGGANLRLTGSDASTDNVKIAGGSNVTITRTDANTITIAATGDGGAVQLNELTDVVITGTPSNGQVLKYDTGTSKWVNGTDAGGGGGASALDDLTDVVFTVPPSVGEVLKFDGVNWVNGTDATGGGGGSGATTLDELTDVVITGTPAADQVLKYNGFSWVNSVPTVNFVDLLGVNISATPAEGEILKYDSILESWINGALAVSLDDVTDVAITSGTLTAGQTLVYDGAGWVNDTLSLGVNDLADAAINFGTLAAGQALVYNGTEWANSTLATSDLTDVDIDSLTLAAGQILKYNGFDWINSDLSLENLSDVSYGVLAPNDFIYWDGTGWTNQNFAVSIDTAPALGGDLDLSSFDITGTGNISIIGDIQSSSVTTSVINAPTGVSVATNDNFPLNVQAKAILNGPAQISLQVFKGSLASPIDTAPGDILGGPSVSGYYGGDFKPAYALFGGWQSGADLTSAYPKAQLRIVVGNNNSTLPTAAVVIRGESVIDSKIFKSVGQTTTAMGTLFPTPEAGMIYFDTTLQKFRGYVTDTGLAGGGASNSTPGWINLN